MGRISCPHSPGAKQVGAGFTARNGQVGCGVPDGLLATDGELWIEIAAASLS